MKLTRDETRILAEALTASKHDLLPGRSKENDLATIKALEKLENKLHECGKDQRRNGRTSQDEFSDCLKRFVNQYKL